MNPRKMSIVLCALTLEAVNEGITDASILCMLDPSTPSCRRAGVPPWGIKKRVKIQGRNFTVFFEKKNWQHPSIYTAFSSE